MTLPGDTRRVLAQETVLNTVISGILTALITWLIFGNQEDIPLLGGPESGAFGIVPGTFMFSAVVTLALSLIMRGRINKGSVTRLPAGSLSLLRKLLPSQVFLRSIAAGLIMWLLLVPTTLLLLSALAPSSISFTGLLVLFVAYFVVLTLIVVPAVILRSLLP